ncbi:hypothetical protein ACIBF6_09055 [Streptosporangium amethystogenes]|uniref:hypothetical protein n=1 Tax=Streptosporangium amethystogenes TaxID=2002 RepID=UPI0037A2717A
MPATIVNQTIRPERVPAPPGAELDIGPRGAATLAALRRLSGAGDYDAPRETVRLRQGGGAVPCIGTEGPPRHRHRAR